MVGMVTHFQFQTPPFEQFGSRETEGIEFAVIEPGTLHVHIPSRSIMGCDSKLTAASITLSKIDDHLREERAGNLVDGVDPTASVRLEGSECSHYKPGTLETYPSSLNHTDIHDIAPRLQPVGLHSHPQRLSTGLREVTRERLFAAALDAELPGMTVHHHLHHGAFRIGVNEVEDETVLTSCGLLLQSKENVVFMSAPSLGAPSASPGVDRTRQHIREIGRGPRLADEVVTVLVAEVMSQKLLIASWPQCQFGSRVVPSAYSPVFLCCDNSAMQGEQEQDEDKIFHKADIRF